MSIKHYAGLVATLAWIGCNVEQVGNVATISHSTDSSSPPPIDLRIDIQDTNRKVGELHIRGNPLVAGEEGEVTIQFTGSQKLNTYEETYGGDGNGNNGVNGNDESRGYFTIYPALNLSFDDNVTATTCDECRGEYINYASKSGKLVQLTDVPNNGIVTLGFKITANKSFTLTARLRGKDINAQGAGTIPVQPNEEQEEAQALQVLLEKAGRSYDSSGQIKPAYTDGKVRHVRLMEGGEEAGHLLLDHQSLRAGQSERSKARFTFISTGKLGGNNARLLIQMPSKLHVHLPRIVIKDEYDRFDHAISSNLSGSVSGDLKTMAKGEYFEIEFSLMPLVSLGSKRPFYFYVHLTNTKFDGHPYLQQNIEVDPHSSHQQGLFADDSFLAEIYEANGGNLLVMQITVWKNMNDHNNDHLFLHCGVACEILSKYSKNLPWAGSQTTIPNDHVTEYNHKSYRLGIKELPQGKTFYIIFSNLSAGQNTEKYYPYVQYRKNDRQVGRRFAATLDWGN